MEFVSDHSFVRIAQHEGNGKKPVGSIGEVELLSHYMTGSAEQKTHFLFAYFRAVFTTVTWAVPNPESPNTVTSVPTRKARIPANIVPTPKPGIVYFMAMP